MAQVSFEVSTGKEKLDVECVKLFLVFEEEIENKILELENAQEQNDIHNKCEEINKYLQEHKYSHNECYQDPFRSYVKDIENEANILLSESSKYSQYCKCLTSKDEECTKPKGIAEELGKENGNPLSEELPANKSNQTASSCNIKSCEDTSSEYKALPDAKQTNIHEHSTHSAKITSEPPEETTVVVDHPIVSTVSEFEKEHSNIKEEKDCSSKGLSSSIHSTTEGSESHPSITSSKTNVLHTSNSTVTSEAYITGIRNTNFGKSLSHYKNGHCELNKNKVSKDSDENMITIHLLDCKSEDAEYIISEDNNHEVNDITANSQISHHTDTSLPNPPNKGVIKSQKVTSTERHQLSEEMKINDQLQSSGLNFLEKKEEEDTGVLSNRGSSNHDTSNKHAQGDQTDHTSHEEATKNEISNENILNKDSDSKEEQDIIDIEHTVISTPPEEPPLRMYITIIAIILGGILFFAFLLKVKINLLY
ncbi:hypothetical protein PCYB_003400 [Plasmodium cynomolgi strain B]|uniref:Uncharacterized protein n=1 Tax=Plasmodium cynomolgi (strain B) TaxID=1120755 RepID=K6UF71_PLACD|nr:hypothetical protein PCYB_003400 [Plasmodium cynomolgi strain B]GAB69591.1 hypothetical protein PCYB_003400 [Plasmodium cynomolgi strain B]